MAATRCLCPGGLCPEGVSVYGRSLFGRVLLVGRGVSFQRGVSVLRLPMGFKIVLYIVTKIVCCKTHWQINCINCDSKYWANFFCNLRILNIPVSYARSIKFGSHLLRARKVHHYTIKFNCLNRLIESEIFHKIKIRKSSVADPGFPPGGGANTLEGDSIWFCQFFPKTA